MINLYYFTIQILAILIIVLGKKQNITYKKIKSFSSLHSYPPNSLVNQGRANKNITQIIVFEIKSKNINQLEQIVLDITDPESRNYGKYLTKERINSIVINKNGGELIKNYLLSEFNKIVEIDLLIYNMKGLDKDNNINEEDILNYNKIKEQNKIKILNNENFLQDEYLIVESSIYVWEKILKTEFFQFLYEDKENNLSKLIYRAPYYTLPSNIYEEISGIYSSQDQFSSQMKANYNFIYNEIYKNYFNFFNRKKNKNKENLKNIRINHEEIKNLLIDNNVKEKNIGIVTPSVLKKLYKIPEPNSTIGGICHQGIYATLDEYLSLKDLNQFQLHNNMPSKGILTSVGNHIIKDEANYKDKFPCSIGKCVEANLDVQYIMAIAPQCDTSFFYWRSQYDEENNLIKEGNSTEPITLDPWLPFLRYLFNLPEEKLPSVISISYGIPEESLPLTYLNLFHIQTLKLVARGVTILTSSGNNGAIGNDNKCGYSPQFPATSPLITVVGGTMMSEDAINNLMNSKLNNSTIYEERACQVDKGGRITSGGGFSTKFSAPFYQKSVVSEYFNSLDKQPFEGYERKGRGYPDVSALAMNYETIVNGNINYISGTSAATPVLAGIISLINKERVSNGKPLVGFLNPILYKYGHLFVNDVISGDNHCRPLTNQEYEEKSQEKDKEINLLNKSICCNEGFTARKGWDPVTGLGTINFEKFRQVMLSI